MTNILHFEVQRGIVLTPYLTGSCLEFTLPKALDLVILEQLVFENGDPDIALVIERLTNRIFLHGTNLTDDLPVIIINLDMVRIMHGFNRTVTPTGTLWV